MTDLPVPATAVIFEDVDPPALGVDPQSGETPALINFCRAALAQMALDPDSVALVVSGDFVASVKRRLPRGPYRDRYDEVRGAGTVGAKTMVVGEEIHVVVPAWQFEDQSSDEATLGVRRTVVHEAQHVAMQQAGEDDGVFPDEPWARANFLTAAHQVIVEYRAELGVPNLLRRDFEVELSGSAVQALQADLVRIDDRYQGDLDVGALSYDVLQQSQHLWKALAYIAAARRNLSIGTPLPVEAEAEGLWEQMGAEHWAQFEGILSRVPSAHTRISRHDLRRVTDELADLLAAWLESLGFEFRDIDHGRNSMFTIVSRHLLRN